MQTPWKALARASGPLVGFPGNRNTLTVDRRSDGLECRVSWIAYLFVLLGTALFGPGIALLLYFHPQGTNRNMPWAVQGFVWLMVLFATFIFMRYLLGTPRLSVDYAMGEIRCFPRRTSSPALVLRRGEVRSLAVELSTYKDSEGFRTTNHYLVATDIEGKRHALCVSTDEKLLEGVKSDLVNAGIGRG